MQSLSNPIAMSIITCDSRDFLVMGDPFQTYNDEVDRFLNQPRPTANTSEEPL
jgi:hypothetical protein